MMLLTRRHLLSTGVSRKARSYKNHLLGLGEFVSFHTCLQILGTQHVGISSHLLERAIHQLLGIGGHSIVICPKVVFALSTSSDLKNRWRIFKDINVNLQRVPKYIVACCVLHNTLIESMLEEPREEDYDPHPNVNNEVYNATWSEQTKGQELRDVVYLE
ncbi:hypothetical protein L7F22_053474 [Adiantum nelumboides]|nr:hypothetical protein [Adiantum nelumboides]